MEHESSISGSSPRNRSRQRYTRTKSSCDTGSEAREPSPDSLGPVTAGHLQAIPTFQFEAQD